MQHNQQGNILFLILIAVALFAALSYAITNSTRNSGGNVSRDTAKANAAALIQFGAALKNTVTRLKISNNCTDATLDFSTPVYTRYDGTARMSANANAPAACKVFDPAGGNLSPFVPPPETLIESTTNGASPKAGSGIVNIGQFKNIGTDGPSGTESANDLFFLITNINRVTCLAINDALSVPNPGGEPPTITSTGSSTSYTNGSLASSMIIEFTDATLNGNATFCRKHSTSDYYYFTQIILER